MHLLFKEMGIFKIIYLQLQKHTTQFINTIAIEDDAIACYWLINSMQ